MDPNPSYPGYYAPPPLNPKKPSLINPKIVLIAVGGLVVLLIAVVLLASSGGSGDAKTLITQAVARQTALSEMADVSAERIVHPDLRQLNADAKLFLASDLKTLTGHMNSYGVKAVPKEIQAAESDTATAEKLDKAALENRFDNTYADVMDQKMDALQALLQELYEKANSTVKPDVETAYQNLQSLQESLEKIRL